MRIVTPSRILICFFCSYIFVILLSSIPLGQNVPLKDSALFSYYASQILLGKRLYLDLWDNKPPLIFLLNALELALWKGSYWGIWLGELVSVSISTTLLFFICRKLWGSFVSFLGVCFYLFGFSSTYFSGNNAEEYIQILFIIMLFIIQRVAERRSKELWYLSLGALSGVAFFLKPSGIGLPVVFLGILLFEVFTSRRSVRSSSFRRIGAFALGSLAVVLGVGIYLVHERIFFAFLDAVFIQGYYYSHEPFFFRLFQERTGILWLLITGALLFGGCGWLLMTRNLLARKKRLKKISASIILLLAYIDLPVELMITMITGHGNNYYFMLCLPSLALLGGYFFSEILIRIKTSRFAKSFTRLMCSFLLLVFLLPFFLISSFFIMRSYLGHRFFSSFQGPFIKEIMKQNPGSRGGSILVWGYQPTFYFSLHSNPPTRFVNQFGLFTKGYQSEKMSMELLSDLSSRAPEYIIDVTSNDQMIQSFDSKRRAANPPPKFSVSHLPQRIGEVETVINRQYSIISEMDLPERFGMGTWYLYKRKKAI